MKRLAKLSGILLLAGCATGSGVPAGVTLQPEEPDVVLFVPDARTINGTWRGSYVCYQGETALELELRGDGAGALEGTFRFRAHPRNPGVPSGSYRVHGRLSPWGIVVLEGGDWIERPDPYVTVGLVGRVEEDRFYGFVDGPGCGTFSVERVEGSRALR